MLRLRNPYLPMQYLNRLWNRKILRLYNLKPSKWCRNRA